MQGFCNYLNSFIKNNFIHLKFTADKVKSIIKKIQKQRILVVGDLMLDEFIWGNVHRISPEAPVPVVQVTKESCYPGGAANVARNLSVFGAKTIVCGRIGNDDNGKKLSELLNRVGILTDGLIITSDFPTIVKTRIIARHQQVVRVDREKNILTTIKEVKKIVSHVKTLLPHIDAIIIEDYGKGFIIQELVSKIIQMAKKSQKIITIDPNPKNPLNWNSATLVKPNRQEAFAAAGVLDESKADIKEIGEQLLAKWKIDSLLITLGEHGMMLFESNKKPYHTPTRAKEVFDVSGAGDTVIAFYTAALSAGFSGRIAAEIANHAAGIVVGKLGTATLSEIELVESFLKN